MAKPMEGKTRESMEGKTRESMESQTSEPVEAKTAEPVEAQRAEPVEAKTAEPVEAKRAEPVEAKTAEPVAAKTVELMEAKRASVIEGKMDALQFDAQSKKLAIANINIPKIRKCDEVLVKVAFSGICGTDLHIIQGAFPCQQQYPVTLGHEFCGTIVDIGKAVSKKYVINDRVVLDPNCGCHVCDHCHSGDPNYCTEGYKVTTLGIYKNGGWTNYCLVPEEQVHKLPDNITFEQGAICEPISCIAHGWDRIRPVSVGEKVLIIGAGIIGNLWAVNLHLQGHRSVTISEPNSARLQQIKKLDLGYDLVSPDDLKQRATADPTYLFDLIIDCSGFGPAIEHGLTLLSRGGKFCIFGVASPETRVSVAPFHIYMQEASIVGVNTNPFTFPKAIGLLESMGERYLNYEALGIQVFALSQYEEAIEKLKTGEISKAVFKFE